MVAVGAKNTKRFGEEEEEERRDFAEAYLYFPPRWEKEIVMDGLCRMMVMGLPIVGTHPLTPIYAA